MHGFHFNSFEPNKNVTNFFIIFFCSFCCCCCCIGHAHIHKMIIATVVVQTKCVVWMLAVTAENKQTLFGRTISTPTYVYNYCVPGRIGEQNQQHTIIVAFPWRLTCFWIYDKCSFSSFCIWERVGKICTYTHKRQDWGVLMQWQQYTTEPYWICKKREKEVCSAGRDKGRMGEQGWKKNNNYMPHSLQAHTQHIYNIHFINFMFFKCKNLAKSLNKLPRKQTELLGYEMKKLLRLARERVREAE